MAVLLKGKPQKTLDDYAEKKPPTGEKTPRAVKRIIKELERVAPKEITMEELSRTCDIPMSQLRTIFSRYNRFFNHVEKIDDGETVKFRLDLKEKYGIKDKPEQNRKKFFKGRIAKK